MTNDIRKNIMLIESIILDESFKDAQQKFSTIASSEEVKSYIEKFKELSKRNIIKGQDKDIGYWIKGDWDSFKKFIDNNSAVITKRQAKVDRSYCGIKMSNAVVIPLRKRSIQYGKKLGDVLTPWGAILLLLLCEKSHYFMCYSRKDGNNMPVPLPKTI